MMDINFWILKSNQIPVMLMYQSYDSSLLPLLVSGVLEVEQIWASKPMEVMCGLCWTLSRVQLTDPALDPQRLEVGLELGTIRNNQSVFSLIVCTQSCGSSSLDSRCSLSGVVDKKTRTSLGAASQPSKAVCRLSLTQIRSKRPMNLSMCADSSTNTKKNNMINWYIYIFIYNISFKFF